MNCRNFAELIHEWLEELLPASEAAAITAHLESCSACQAVRDRASLLRHKVRFATRGSFPEIAFCTPSPSFSAEKPPRDRGWTVERVLLSLAASMLLLMGAGNFYNQLVLNRLSIQVLATESAKQQVDAHQSALADTPASQLKLAQEYAEAITKARNEINSQPVRLVVNGPAGVVGGAPTQYLAQAIDPSGRNLAMRLEASLEDPRAQDKLVALDVTPLPNGTHRISLPPDTPLPPGADPILRVRALPPENFRGKPGEKILPLAEITERIKLGLPPLTTHLSTDKRLYQPGEIVRFRSLTLERSTLKPPVGSLKLRARLICPDQSERLILTSDGLLALPDDPSRPLAGPSGRPLRGVLAGELPLELDQSGGEYTLRVEEADSRFVTAERKFLVQVYQKPRLNKELVFSKRGYAPGDTMDIAVTGTGVDGQSLAGQPVTARLNLDGKTVRADSSLAPSDHPPEKANLDSAGKGVFRFKLPQESAIAAGEAVVTVIFTDGASIEPLIKPVPLVLDRVDVTLHPEGGDLVAGLPGRVYFSARTRQGKPTDLTARLLENGLPIGKTIRTLSDLANPGANQGLGVFEFIPKAGTTYTLELLTPSQGSRVALPEIKPAGLSLRVECEKLAPGGKVPARLLSSDEGIWFIGLYCRGRLLDSRLVTGKDNLVELEPQADLGGVCRLTAFRVEPGEANPGGKPGRGSLKPVAERLIWRPLAENLRVETLVEHAEETKQGPGFLPGAKVRLKVLVRDGQGKPTGAMVLASVVDQSVVTLADEKTTRSMPTHFLLGEEVLHPEDLEYADFLLTGHPQAKKAIDLLLGTQGWRRFAEQDPAKFQVRQPVEAPGFLVSAGLASQHPAVSTERALEEKIHALAPEFDARFQSLEEQEVQNRARLLTTTQDWEHQKELESGIKSWAIPKLTVFAMFCSFASAWLALVIGACRGRALWARLAIATIGFLLAFLPLALIEWEPDGPNSELIFNLTLVSPNAAPSLSTSTVIEAVNSPPRVMEAVTGKARDDRWSNAGKATTAKSASPPQPAPTRNEGLVKNRPLPGAIANPLFEQANTRKKLPNRSALLSGGSNLEITGGIEGIDRLLLPKGLTTFGSVLESIAGEDLPPVPVIREFNHSRPLGTTPATRTDFTETLLWKPVWVLPSGEGSTEFDLADSVTRYVATVSANTEDGRLASASTTWESRLPLVISWKLPAETTAGDLLEVPISLEGEPNAQVEWIIKSLRGGLVEGSGRGQVNLDGNGRARALVRLRPGTETAALDYQIEASSGIWRDSLQGKIRVVAEGFPVSGALAVPLEGRQERVLRLPGAWRKGSLSLRVEAFPSPLGEVLAGLEGMLREPHGCFEQTSSTSYPNLMILRLLKAANHVHPELEKKARDLLAKGYARLTGFECLDTKAGFKQGFDWFGKTDAQHEALTAYGLLQFTAMRAIGLEGMDPTLIPRTRAFLLGKRDGMGGFSRNSQNLDSFGAAETDITNAYILWAMANSGDINDLKPEFDALEKRADNIKDPYEMALAANALLRAGRVKAGRTQARRLGLLQSAEGSVPGAATSITRSMGSGLVVETTSLCAIAWLESGSESSNLVQAMVWLAGQKQAGGSMGSTQATILALEAMTRFQESALGKTRAGTLQVSVGKKDLLKLSFQEGAIDRFVAELDEKALELPGGETLITLDLSGGNRFPCLVSWSYHTDTPPSSPKASIRLATSLDRTVVAEGESVRLNLAVRNTNQSKSGMVMVLVGLPASLSVPTDARQLIDYTRAPPGGEPRLAAWEQRGNELALYWRAMKPGQEITLPLDLEARIPGETHGQASRSYQYYSPDDISWVQGLRLKVNPRP